MLRRSRVKWYAGVACVIAAVTVVGGVALAQSRGGPALKSSTGGGPGCVQVINGQAVAASSCTPPAGSTSYGYRGSGSGKVTKAYSGSEAATRHGANAAARSLRNSQGGGPGCVQVINGQAVAASSCTPPAGSTSYGYRGSGSGKVTKTYSGSHAATTHAGNAAGPSLHSSTGGSGPGTINGPGGQFVPGDGSAPPPAPPGANVR